MDLPRLLKVAQEHSRHWEDADWEGLQAKSHLHQSIYNYVCFAH